MYHNFHLKTLKHYDMDFDYLSLQVISETPMSNQPAGRSLLQAVVPDVKPPIMFNVSGAPCIMLWAQNLNVSLSKSAAWIDLAAQTPSLTGSMCNSTNSRWDDLHHRVFCAC